MGLPCKNKCCKLEIITLTSTGTQFNITVAQQPLIDGAFYSVSLRGLAFPTEVTGSESVVITVGTTTIAVGDCRARRLLAERVNQCTKLCMRYTVDSIVGGAAGATPPQPAFLVFEGVTPIKA